MRIVAGKWKGAAIEAPRGKDVTRPTTDRVREAIASMAQSCFGLCLDGVRVLDGYAGSGAMGFEMLSRGCAHVSFMDKDKPSYLRIKRTAKNLGATADEAYIGLGDVEKAATRPMPGSPFDLVFLDPPYAKDICEVERLVDNLYENNNLGSQFYIIYEHGKGQPALSCPYCTLIKQKRYGTCLVDLYGKKEDIDG